MNYNAFVVSELENKYSGNVEEVPINNLPENQVLIKVHYSSLNYKDALSATGNNGVTREYPHTPGIDAAGMVESSKGAKFKQGDKVIVTSYDLGMNTPGGFAEYIYVPEEWIVPLPNGLTLKQAMMIGTAGLTAAAGVEMISDYVKTIDGEILVTGATGGVGCIATMLLSKLGYKVVVSSGKSELREWLLALGASNLISRNRFATSDSRAMNKALWAAAFDTVGGLTLENIIKSVQPFGVVASCGNVAGANLNLTVYPFILRGLKLMGISSQNLPMPERIKLWNLLATDWKLDKLEDIVTEINLAQLPEYIDKILNGRVKGRVVVRL